MSTMDWLMASVFKGEAELSPETQRTFIEHVESFLRAQGFISWNEWSLLSVESKAALLEAGRRIDRDRAAAVARIIMHGIDEPDDGVKDEPAGPPGGDPDPVA